jgi:glycosyltransferase involved in cell wall biosynthesis
MKVMFINGSERKGGAAIVAYRLRHALTNIPEIQALAVVASRQTGDENVVSTRTKAQAFIEQVIDRITSKLGLQYQFFPFSSSSIIKEVQRFKPDIINIHNTHGGYFPTTLLMSLSQYAPIVWTLHDMWSFTGNSAHTFGDTMWIKMKHPSRLTRIPPEIGVNLGALLLRQKKNVYAKSRLTIVTPSKWLANLAMKSPLFVNKSIHQIFNGVDLSVFKPYGKETVRAELGLPDESPILIFSADFLKRNVWKGGADLINVLQKLNATVTKKVHLVILGADEMEELNLLSNFIIHPIGYVESEQDIARYLSAADLLIYPTRADNLPNVLIEAIACGLPCVTFDIGGCSEIIKDGVNGRVVLPADLDGMALAIAELLNDSGKRASMMCNARISAEEKFSIDKMANEYNKLFESLIGRPQNHLERNV